MRILPNFTFAESDACFQLQRAVSLNHGTPCLRELGSLLLTRKDALATPSDSYDQAIARADKENGSIPGMCHIANELINLAYENGRKPENHFSVKLLLNDIKWHSSEAAKAILIKDFLDEHGGVVENYVMDTKNKNSRFGRYVLSNCGDERVMMKLARRLVGGEAGFPAFCEGVNLYEKLIKGGSVGAPFQLAQVLLKGGKVPPTINYAMRLLHQGAEELGCLDSMEKLTEIYSEGLHGQKVNVEKMCDMLERRVATGKDSRAVTTYASMLETGTKGVRKDLKKACEVLEKGGDDSLAMWKLATLMEKGDDGLPRNEWRAVELYKKLRKSNKTNLVYRFALARLYRGDSYQVPSDHQEVQRLCDNKNSFWGGGSSRLKFDDYRLHIEYLYNKSKFDIEGSRKQALHRAVLWVERMLHSYEDSWVYNMAGVLMWESGSGNSLTMFQDAMDMGSKVARFNLANRLCQVNCHPDARPLLDIKRGVDLYETAIAEGDYHAMIELGLILKFEGYGEYGIETDFQRAASLLKLGIFLGFRTNVAGSKKWQRYGWSSETEIIEKLKMDGSFESKVYDEAFDYNAEESGVYVAMLHLAEIVMFHQDEPDIEMALLLVEHASIKADFEELSTIGFPILRHIFEAQRIAKEARLQALSMMENLIGKTGDITTMRVFALYILTGMYVAPKDERKAMSMLKRAAFAGDVKSKLLLADLLGVHSESKENCYECFHLLTSAIHSADYSAHSMMDAVEQLSHVWFAIREKMDSNARLCAENLRDEHRRKAEVLMGKSAASISELTSMLLHDGHSGIADWIFTNN